MKKLFIIVFLLFVWEIVVAQEPIVKGKVNISILNGTIDADLELSNIPKIKNYEIMLNTGLNMNVIREDKYDFNYYFGKYYDSKISFESFLYSIKNENGKILPDTLRFVYSGKFPVKSDSLYLKGSRDWKGNIAFNGKTLRMDGVQSNWYPVLIDLEKDIKYDAVKYDIEITCEDCQSLYVNGNEPVRSQKHRFKSDIPIEMLMFIGDYSFEKVKETYYLNQDITKEEIEEFSVFVEKFKSYYSKKTGIPYKGNFNFIHTSPLFTRKSGFLFVSYPTITNVGKDNYGLKGFVGKENMYAKPLIAHELAHYYFGSGYRKFNSEIGAVIQESFAEYMSFKASREVLGKEAYDNKLNALISSFEKNENTLIPISKIKSKNDLNSYYQLYAYNYFPALLLAIEKEIGEEKMWRWINYLLTDESEYTDFHFLENTLRKAINNESKSSLIIKKFFLSENNLNSVLENIK